MRRYRARLHCGFLWAEQPRPAATVGDLVEGLLRLPQDAPVAISRGGSLEPVRAIGQHIDDDGVLGVSLDADDARP